MRLRGMRQQNSRGTRKELRRHDTAVALRCALQLTLAQAAAPLRTPTTTATLTRARP
jgi:hypothetical protein